MSLLIDVNKVSSVLLADGWHQVDKLSFEMDAYEFCINGGGHRSRMRLSGAQEPLVPATGARWVERTESSLHRTSPDFLCIVYCPVTAILAVKEIIPTASQS